MVNSGLLTFQFRRVAPIAYRFLTIKNFSRPCLENTMPSFTNFTKGCSFHGNCFGIRSYTSISKYDAFDEEPVIGYSLSSLYYSDAHGYVTLNMSGFEKTESNEDLCVFLCMPGVTLQDVKVCVERNTWLVIKAETHDRLSYEAEMRLPENVDKTSSDIKGEMQPDGMFKLTFPKLKNKESIKTNSIFDNFIFKLKLRLFASVIRPLILRTYLIEEIYAEAIDSFTEYMEVTANSRLHVRFTFGIFEKMELTREGARVSLNMPELKIDDVECYCKGDIFFIKGKTKTNMNKMHYYVTAIRLPKSIMKERDMIKTEMQDGMYMATLPYVTTDIKFS